MLTILWISYTIIIWARMGPTMEALKISREVRK